MIGTELGEYRIVDRLGAGGMGVVYRARDLRLDREVALKILPSKSMGDEVARARLLREAKTASALNHPHICHIYAAGETDGNIWFAMELIEGKTLKDLIPPGGFPAETVIRYGTQIADALAHAHERNIVHRDLKSANVIVTPEGRAKILDFGLAKRIAPDIDGDSSDSLELTRSGIVVGTPNYLAPEVLRGRSADERGDLWTLGVLLYEMTCGHPPFQGGNFFELTSNILEKPPLPLPVGVAPGLEAVIRRCLQKDPHERYQQAGEARDALEALRSDSGSRAVVREEGPRRIPRRAWYAGLAVLGLLAAAGIITRLQSPGDEERPVIRSLAVLPLANLSGDPQQEYFADGMTEELITNLAAIPSLKVISRTSAMRYKDSRAGLPEIARELGVDGVVEGSVTRAGDRVRITAQLVDARSDQHLWAESYERDLREVLSLQREVARDIASEIRLTLDPATNARLTGGRRVNPEAYELYLKGRFNVAKVTDEAIRLGIRIFEQAVAIDPKDPLPYTGIADAYVLLGHLLETEPVDAAMPIVQQNATMALELDDASPEAHTSMALALMLSERKWPEAERHIARALALNPNYALAHLARSIYSATRGDFEGALAASRAARDLDPLSLLNNWHLGIVLMNCGRHDEAIAVAEKTLEIDPTSQLPQRLLVEVYQSSGNFVGALNALERWLPEEDGGRVLVSRMRAAYDAEGAAGYWRSFIAAIEGDSHASCMGIAAAYAQLGEREKAFEYLQRGIDQRTSDILFMRVTRLLEPLRDDPRFEEIARKAGLPQRPA